MRIYDPEMGLNDYAYISKLVRNIGQEYKNTIEVTTSELGVNRHSLQSSLARMNAIAE